MKMRVVHVDRVRRFSLEVDDESGGTYLAIPVRNQMVEYCEWYSVDAETFASFVADPTLAFEMVDRAKSRELDDRLLFQPGTDRGWP